MPDGVTTGWVLPPKPIGGLDHLGVQAPCTALYAQLLPGITNVTDRARYYSFHTWLVRQFEQRYQDHSPAAFSRIIRRAECLFALAAIRHGSQAAEPDAGRHDAAVVGRQELQQVEDAVFDLDDFAGLETQRRYFKNHRGGLGQYYFGSLRDLRVLDNASGEGRSSVPGYDKDRGLALAAAFDAGVDAARFFEILDAPTVRNSDIDDIVGFCPCHLSENAPEREHLRDLFLARTSLYAEGGKPRRATLGLLLDLIANGVARHPDLSFENAFRVVVYAGVLPNGEAWSVPTTVAAVQRGWGTYHRNELFSVAVQALFAAILRDIEVNHAGRLETTDHAGPIGVALCGSISADVLAESLPIAVKRIQEELPSLDAWTDPSHEMQLGWGCLKAFEDDQRETLAVNAVRILLALAARGLAHYPYTDFDLDPDYFDTRELHLVSFRQHLDGRWATMSVGEWIAWLAVHWGLERHLRVALRKLRSQRQDTFRIRPTDLGLRVVEVPPPAFTVPRVGRALQILRDLDLVDRVAGGFDLTDAGRVEREKICG